MRRSINLLTTKVVTSGFGVIMKWSDFTAMTAQIFEIVDTIISFFLRCEAVESRCWISQNIFDG